MPTYTFVEAPGYGLIGHQMPGLEDLMALPEEATHGVRTASCVFASAPITRVASSMYVMPAGTKTKVLRTFCIFEREDGKPMIALFVIDMRYHKGQSGIYVFGESLPLKERSGYKKESGGMYVDAKYIKRFTPCAMLKTPDLDGYISHCTGV